MRTQQDTHTRIVTLDNLRALCRRASGMCHRYTITKVSRSRVHVEYSNPDEWGNSHPIVAVFPCLPGFCGLEDKDNPRVLLGEMLRVIGETDSEDWQHFDPIVSAPPLYRSYEDKAETWRTRAEIAGTDRYLCPDGIVRTVDQNHPYTNDTFAAFDVTSETPAEYFTRRGGNRHFAFFTWSDLTPVKE